MDEQLTIIQILTSKKTCRVCLLQRKDLRSMSQHVENINLLDAYFEVVGHRIESSLITTSICEECQNLLIKSYNFKIQCENTQKIILENAELVDTLTEVKANVEDTSPIFEDPLVTVNQDIDDITQDVEIVSEKEHSCKNCGRNYRTYNSLRRHIKDHHYNTQGDDEGHFSYNCIYCDKKYNIQNSYYKHFKSVHPKEYQDSLEAPKENSTVLSKSTRISCDLCYKNFKSSSTYLRHVNQEHPESAQALKEMMKVETGEESEKLKLCPTCGIMTNSKHIICCGVEQKHNFTCKICNLKIKQSSNYFSHMRIHNDDKKYKCDYCGIKFIHWSSWREHEDVKHLNVKRYSCKICNAPFFRRLALIMHTRREHTGERPYECETCQKKFISGNGLKNHMACHSTAKNFKCTACNKEFSRKKTLQVHQKIHSNIKNYSCTVCQRKFLRNHVLKSHIKTQHSEVLFG